MLMCSVICKVCCEQVCGFLLDFLYQSQGNPCTNTCYSVVLIGQLLFVLLVPVDMFWFP